LRTERLALPSGTAQDAQPTFASRRLESVGQWLTDLPTDVDQHRATFPGRSASRHDHCGAARRGHRGYMLRVDDARAQEEDVPDRARGQQAEIG
jgi:hypothetical protein